MPRNAKTEKTKMDLLQPVNVGELKQLIKDDDCFGKEWNPQHKDCSICADVEVCGIIYQDTKVMPAKVKFDKETLPLDMATFEAVNWGQIKKLVRQYEKDDEPLSMDELVEIAMTQSGMKDPQIVMLYIEQKLPELGLVHTEQHKIIFIK